MTVSTFDKNNLDSILSGNGDWFDAHLLRFLDEVLFKADREHFRVLWMNWPEHCRQIYAHYGWSDNSISEHVIRLLDV